MNGIIAYCRPGYESDTASELSAFCTAKGVYGYPELDRNAGYVTYKVTHLDDQRSVDALFDVAQTIFPRQIIGVIGQCQQLDRQDRISPIVEICRDNSAIHGYGDVIVEYPDTEDGKSLAKFCRKFVVPLRQALRSEHVLSNKPDMKLPRLHVFFTSFESCVVGFTTGHASQIEPMGICRLKFPPDAPSRSTLKLEEAIKTMLSDAQREMIFRSGARAVDLGACPGGWTYQLVSRGMHVDAIDNGLIADNLMQTGLVEHHQVDGFVFKPKRHQVELLVCDMIERPDKVAALMTEWLLGGWARHAIFNLKLPMKKRFEMVETCLRTIQESLDKHVDNFTLTARHLYHDRDEVTVVIVRNSATS